LLVASGLFLHSLVKLTALDVGFDRNNVLLVHANLHHAKVAPEQQPAMFEEIEGRLRALPGAVSASRAVMTPVSDFVWNNHLQVDTPNPPTGKNALAFFNFISPGYLGTMRTPLLAGRNFNAGDVQTAPLVAIVNETLARRFFPKGDALGKYFRSSRNWASRHHPSRSLDSPKMPSTNRCVRMPAPPRTSRLRK
jgi:putative ABC transport system permease protein